MSVRYGVFIAGYSDKEPHPTVRCPICRGRIYDLNLSDRTLWICTKCLSVYKVEAE